MGKEVGVLLALAALSLSHPSNVFAYRTTTSLEQRINEVEKIVLRKKGLEIASYKCPVELGNERTNLNLRFEYKCGLRGGSGALRALFYLDLDEWFSAKGIKEIRLFCFSPEAMGMSVKEYEVNLNLHTKHITYEPVQQRVLVSNYLFDKAKDIIYKLLKGSEEGKEIEKDIKKSELVGNIVKVITDDELRQATVEAGNLIIKEHVYLTEFDYQGYGFFDDMTGELRAPKAYELEIERGECGIKGFYVKAKVCGFKEVYFGKGQFGTKRYEDVIEFAAPLDVESAAKVYGARPETSSKSEE